VNVVDGIRRTQRVADVEITMRRLQLTAEHEDLSVAAHVAELLDLRT